MTDTLYKVTGENGQCIYGIGSWPLPTEDKPGKWLKAEGELIPCQNGLMGRRKRVATRTPT